MSTSGPAPSRMASRCMRRLRSTLRSTLSSGSNGEPKPGRQPCGLPSVVDEDVGLQRREASFRAPRAPIALTPSRSVMAGLYQLGMVDAPGRAVRPVDPDAVAHLAAEQLVAGHAQRLGLGVEQRVLDGAERLRHHAAGGRPRRGNTAPRRSARAATTFWPTTRAASRSIAAPTPGAPKPSSNSLQPTMPSSVDDLDEVVVAPAGVAGERLDASDRWWPFS